MLKIGFKLIILVLLFAFIVPFLIKGPDGKSMLSVKDIKWPSLKMPELKNAEKMVDKAKDVLPNKDTISRLKKINPWKKKEKIKAYKWKNKDGSWVFSDHPNPDGPYDVFYIDPSKDLVSTDMLHNSEESQTLQKKSENK